MVRGLAAQNIWAPRDHTDWGNNPDVELPEVLEDKMELMAQPPWRAPQWRMPPGDDNPTNWLLDQWP